MRLFCSPQCSPNEDFGIDLPKSSFGSINQAQCGFSQAILCSPNEDLES